MNKDDAQHFLKKELDVLAKTKGDKVTDKQKDYDKAKADKVKIKDVKIK